MNEKSVKSAEDLETEAGEVAVKVTGTLAMTRERLDEYRAANRISPEIPDKQVLMDMFREGYRDLFGEDPDRYDSSLALDLKRDGKLVGRVWHVLIQAIALIQVPAEISDDEAEAQSWINKNVDLRTVIEDPEAECMDLVTEIYEGDVPN
jgi:hypothetical protein